MNEPHKTDLARLVITEQEDNRKQILVTASQNKIYQQLQNTWTQEEVGSYLRQIVHNLSIKNLAESTIQRLQETTPMGVAIDFHERFEMTRVEKMVDDHWGIGTFRKKLGEGNLREVDHYFKVENNRERRIEPYWYAHQEAMRAEVAFIQEIAEKLGYKVRRLAIFLAKPNIWKNSANTTHTIESFYKNIRTGNVVRKESEESNDYPVNIPPNLQAEIVVAEQFFIDFGDRNSYVILPSEVIRQNGFYSKKIIHQ